MISGEKVERQVIFEPELIVRRSTGPVREAARAGQVCQAQAAQYAISIAQPMIQSRRPAGPNSNAPKMGSNIFRDSGQDQGLGRLPSQLREARHEPQHPDAILWVGDLTGVLVAKTLAHLTKRKIGQLYNAGIVQKTNAQMSHPWYNV